MTREQVMRRRKAIAIAAYLERLAGQLSAHTTPFDAHKPSHWQALINTVQWASQDTWNTLSIAAGQRPASPKTQIAVLEILQGRQAAGRAA